MAGNLPLHKLPELHYPNANLALREENGIAYVYDQNRRKWLVLTPEEWVRQHVLYYLTTEKGFSAGLLNTEATLTWNGMPRRSDIVCYGTQGKPLLLVECKAANVKINQSVFTQASLYNNSLKAPFLLITNGLVNFCCTFNFDTTTSKHLDYLPDFTEMENYFSGTCASENNIPSATNNLEELPF